ncbi:hypothetical protein F2Q69_00022490 [Brassica cretica]|uniref:Uncharacterized protein n=1 Tax=Brassica cretica TaxID=69181 RepID=A0A8S9QIQ4_BRACR|nr:hypothetical protein F2Q69_00022490 [Brassica cretica]
MISSSKRTSWIDSTRSFAELDQSSSANGRAGSTTGFRSAVRRAGPVQFGERPSWIDHRIQLGRSPSWTSQVRRTAELDRPRDSDRPFAELDQSSSANGRAGSTTGFSSAVRRAGPVQFGERPSWIDRNPSSPRPRSSSPEIVSNSLLFRLDRRLLELSNSLTALAAEAFIISSLAVNPGPQRKLGFLDFPPIAEIDGVNFGSHSIGGRDDGFGSKHLYYHHD